MAGSGSPIAWWLRHEFQLLDRPNSGPFHYAWTRHAPIQSRRKRHERNFFLQFIYVQSIKERRKWETCETSRFWYNTKKIQRMHVCVCVGGCVKVCVRSESKCGLVDIIIVSLSLSFHWLSLHHRRIASIRGRRRVCCYCRCRTTRGKKSHVRSASPPRPLL